MWFLILLAVVFFTFWWIEEGNDEDVDKWFRWR